NLHRSIKSRMGRIVILWKITRNLACVQTQEILQTILNPERKRRFRRCLQYISYASGVKFSAEGSHSSQLYYNQTPPKCMR
ncbi:PIPO, partial [Pennisetum mosaic virus]|uniref:PIPO n=1 Tax=Pennisetum mosaic virus TaxID=221262 RepID=UPI00026512EC